LEKSEGGIKKELDKRDFLRARERSAAEFERKKARETQEATRKAYHKRQCDSVAATLKRHKYKQMQGYHNEAEKHRQEAYISDYEGFVDYWCK